MLQKCLIFCVHYGILNYNYIISRGVIKVAADAPIRVVELFAGVGGFRVGLGFKQYGQTNGNPVRPGNGLTNATPGILAKSLFVLTKISLLLLTKCLSMIYWSAVFPAKIIP